MSDDIKDPTPSFNGKEVKQAKREARQIWEEAREAFAAGNYRRAAELDERIRKLSPDSEQGRQAAEQLEGLKLDRWVLYSGLMAVLFYLVAWWQSLS